MKISVIFFFFFHFPKPRNQVRILIYGTTYRTPKSPCLGQFLVYSIATFYCFTDLQQLATANTLYVNGNLPPNHNVA